MRAAIYCRISDDRTGLAAGVQRQEADARSLCGRNGWDIVAVETDNDISASRYSRKVRPAYQRVLAMAAAGEVDVIACYDVDRLYRRPAELEELIDLAERVVVASVQGDLRLDTSDGRAVARVLAAMAAKASDDTSRRVKRKHLETAQAGLPSGGGPRPFGFEEDRVTVRESEAARIREAAGRILGGEGLGAICRDWAAAGVVTPKGNRWETSALRRMLEAPRVAGKRSLGSEVVADAVWPAILEEEAWVRVKAVLGQRTAEPAPRSYLLAGLIFCGACGAPMGSAPLTVNGKRYRRYFCQAKRGGCNRVGINADRAEAWLTVAMLKRIRSTGTTASPGTIDVAGGATLELMRQEAQLGALAESLADERIDLAAYEAASVKVRTRVSDLRKLIASEQRSGDVKGIAEADDPEAFWRSLPFDRQRAVFVEVLERVEIAPSSGRGAGFEGGRISPVWG